MNQDKTQAQGHTPTPFTAEQRALLAHMERNNVNAFHCDPLRRWVWKSDVRSDAEIARVAVEYLGRTVQS